MQFIRAKSAANKLEVRDNRLFAIEEIRLLSNGFLISLYDVLNRTKPAFYFSSLDELYKDWEVLNDLEDVINQKVTRLKDYKSCNPHLD